MSGIMTQVAAAPPRAADRLGARLARVLPLLALFAPVPPALADTTGYRTPSPS